MTRGLTCILLDSVDGVYGFIVLKYMAFHCAHYDEDLDGYLKHESYTPLEWWIPCIGIDLAWEHAYIALFPR